jgi:hypothetical protein
MDHAHQIPPQLAALQGQAAGQRRTLVPIQRPVEEEKKKSKRRGIFSFLKPKEEEPLEIGTPYDYKQHLHVGFDPVTGTFQGLPPDWTAMLSSSGISAQEASQHSDSILKVLEFQSRILKNDLPPPPPPAFIASHQEDYDEVRIVVSLTIQSTSSTSKSSSGLHLLLCAQHNYWISTF